MARVQTMLFFRQRKYFIYDELELSHMNDGVYFPPMTFDEDKQNRTSGNAY